MSTVGSGRFSCQQWVLAGPMSTVGSGRFTCQQWVLAGPMSNSGFWQGPMSTVGSGSPHANSGFWQVPFGSGVMSTNSLHCTFGRYYFKKLPSGNCPSRLEHFQHLRCLLVQCGWCAKWMTHLFTGPLRQSMIRDYKQHLARSGHDTEQGEHPRLKFLGNIIDRLS